MRENPAKRDLYLCTKETYIMYVQMSEHHYGIKVRRDRGESYALGGLLTPLGLYSI